MILYQKINDISKVCSTYSLYSGRQIVDRACLHELAHHFKTDHTETVALCFGIPTRNRFSSVHISPFME
jgi:hypothetical protein